MEKKVLMKEVNKCPLCGSSERKKLYDSNINDFDTKDFKITDSQYGKHWTFFKCKSCGFVYSNPTPTKELLEKIYSSIEDPDYDSEEEGRSDNFKRILKRIKKIKNSGTLLDVGAATGIFMKLAKERGFEVEGIEPSLWAAKKAEEKYGFKIHNTTFENFETDKKYDIITMLDLIEHVENPLEILKKANSLLNKNGLLVLVTPDIDSLLRKITGSRWWHFRPPHVNFFNIKSLKFALNKEGFEIISIKPYHWKFSLYYLISRFNIGRKIYDKIRVLKRISEKIKIKLFLFDSVEVYARKKDN